MGRGQILEILNAELWAALLTSCVSIVNISWIVPTDRIFIDFFFFKGACLAF